MDTIKKTGDMKRSDIIGELSTFIRKQGILENLMQTKKAELGVGPDQLVFVGTADMAEYFWCAEKSILKSRLQEVRFFESYLFDRIVYSFDLGRLNNLPNDHNELLSIGDDISQPDIEVLLRENKVEEPDDEILQSKVAKEGIWLTLGVINGVHYVIGFPDEIAREMNMNMSDTEVREVVFVNSIDDPALPPKLRGVVGEDAYAEKYPSIRWNFNFGKYIMVGTPDGITDDFVYEFKTTKNKYLERFIKPVAETQADLYGHFFGRGEKRVQIREYESGKIFTYQTEVNRQRVKQVYDGFQSIDEGKEAIPPKAWKCKKCEFELVCPISQG